MWFWPLLDRYGRESKFRGADHWDYLTLYESVRRLKPREVLECGTGLTTVPLAAALADNEREGHGPGRVTSMEDMEPWHDMAVRLFPDELKAHVDMVLSPRTEYTYAMFRGAGYAEVPERPYTFAWVDGPDPVLPADGQKTFDFDFLNVVRRSDQPVWGLIDARNMTAFVFQKIFGTGKVRHDAMTGIVYLGPCRRADMEVFTDHSHATDLRRSGSTIASWSVRGVSRRIGGFVPEGPLDGSDRPTGAPAGEG
jgi:hypothetical protein